MIGIGISTYNDFLCTKELINSIIRNTPLSNARLVVVDDGTKDERTVNALKKVCSSFGAEFARNPENRGIPYTWNRLTELCAPESEDIAVIFNNDIIVPRKTDLEAFKIDVPEAEPDCLKSMEYFLTRNEKIGTVGFPLIYPAELNRERNWGDKPGHVGAAVGCCFGFKKSVWEQIKNPDGSTGFWEDLISFHEETQFGFRLSELGYYNYMLPWPPMIHFGGQTFNKNRELLEREVDWSRWDRQEYIELVKKSKHYPEEWKQDRIAWKNAQNRDVVDRMAFSRYMFAKHWNVLEYYDAPQMPVHERVVTPMPKRRVKWLDMEMREREAEG